MVVLIEHGPLFRGTPQNTFPNQFWGDLMPNQGEFPLKFQWPTQDYDWINKHNSNLASLDYLVVGGGNN